MKVQNPYSDVSRSEVIKVILSAGRRDEHGKGLCVIVAGPTGSGKSAILDDLKKSLPNHTPILCDLTTKEAGDLLMPKVVEREDKLYLTFAPSDELGFNVDGPVILCFDELHKGNRAIQNATCRILHEGKIGNNVLHPDSIVWGTSNLGEEGFGDNRLAYMDNRVVNLTMKMPTSAEWIEGYALGANVHPTVLTTVSEITQMLQDFREVSKPEDNPYIFHPNASDRRAFTSCRSLDNASRALYRAERDNLPASVLGHILSGIIGAPAAAEMTAIHLLHDSLPRYEDVIKDPKNAKLPQEPKESRFNAAAMCLFTYTAIQRAEPKHVSALMTYIQRMPIEIQAMFFFGVIRSPKAAQLTPENGMIAWGKDNSWTVRDN